MTQPKKTSYGAEPVPSPSEYGVVGHCNRWGGFHGTTDPFAYLGLLKILVLNLKARKFVFRMLRDRWRHRACDTMDFHHSIYCTLDPYGKKLDDQYRWTRVWTGSR